MLSKESSKQKSSESDRGQNLKKTKEETKWEIAAAASKKKNDNEFFDYGIVGRPTYPHEKKVKSR